MKRVSIAVLFCLGAYLTYEAVSYFQKQKILEHEPSEISSDSQINYQNMIKLLKAGDIDKLSAIRRYNIELDGEELENQKTLVSNLIKQNNIAIIPVSRFDKAKAFYDRIQDLENCHYVTLDVTLGGIRGTKKVDNILHHHEEGKAAGPFVFYRVQTEETDLAIIEVHNYLRRKSIWYKDSRPEVVPFTYQKANLLFITEMPIGNEVCAPGNGIPIGNCWAQPERYCNFGKYFGLIKYEDKYLHYHVYTRNDQVHLIIAELGLMPTYTGYERFEIILPLKSNSESSK